MSKRHVNYDYLRQTEEGYPYKIFWKVIAPADARLSCLQEYDVIFDKYDENIRKLPNRKISPENIL